MFDNVFTEILISDYTIEVKTYIEEWKFIESRWTSLGQVYYDFVSLFELEASGEPLTWFPLKRLVEQEFLNIDVRDVF